MTRAPGGGALVADWLPGLVGFRSFGRSVADAEGHAALRSAIGAPGGDADRGVHPLYVFVLTQRGMGLSIADFLALCRCDPADGPMLGACEIRVSRAIRLGREYGVEAEITEARRTRGRRLGPFDLVTLEARMLDGEGQETASCSRAYVLPRPEVDRAA